jgi:serine/threonine protein kinase
VLLAQKFKAVSYIGAGGMGVVYRATDISLNRTVALKTLERLSGAAAERLATEARMMAVVAHPNLATIFGVERWRQTPVLVLEFFERGTLAARLGAAQPIDEMLRLGVLLAPALEQLHASGILHRDIKPSNIGLTRDEAPKLLDFGLASLVTAASREGTRSTRGRSGRETQTVDLGVTHRLAGTPLYLPPETLQGVTPNPAFDLWALSMVLFEAIAGWHPFAADSVEAVLAKVGRARVPDLSTIRRDCPAVVAAAFRGLLAADPGRRPATARDFGSVIAGLL